MIAQSVFKAIDEFEVNLKNDGHQQMKQGEKQQLDLWSEFTPKISKFSRSKNQPVFLPANQIPPLM